MTMQQMQTLHSLAKVLKKAMNDKQYLDLMAIIEDTTMDLEDEPNPKITNKELDLLSEFDEVLDDVYYEYEG